jgi:hypothetical protein
MQACAHTPLPTQPFSVAEEKFAALIVHLQSAQAQKMTHSEMERNLDEEGRELLRLLFQGHLDTRGPGEANEPVVDAEGQERTSKRLHERGLATVFGKVDVRRLGYGAAGADSLHPLDGELNLPRELYSHELRRRAAEEVAKGSYDEAVATLARSTGSAVHKRQVEELALRAAQDFDAFYKQKSPQPVPGSLLVLSFDGKGVVMRREDLRPATRKAAQKRQQRLSKRLSKGEKKNAKRMAEVAAVYTIAPFVRTPEQVAGTLAPVHLVSPQKRPRPEAKRVWASLEKDPEQVIEQAFEEANRRDPETSEALGGAGRRQPPPTATPPTHEAPPRRRADGRARPHPRRRVPVESRLCLLRRSHPRARRLGQRAVAQDPPRPRLRRRRRHPQKRYATRPQPRTARGGRRRGQLLAPSHCLPALSPIPGRRLAHCHRRD